MPARARSRRSTAVNAARPTILGSRFSPKRAADEVRYLLEEVIGLDVIEEALILHVAGEIEQEDAAKSADSGPKLLSAPSKYRVMLERMQDRGLTGGQTVLRLMADANVNVFELLALTNARARSFAIAKSAARIDNVLESLANAAEDAEIDCAKCEGEGEILGDRAEPALGDLDAPDLGESAPEFLIPCPECAGSGRQIVPGAIESQKMFLGVHGIGAKGSGAGAGTTVNVLSQQGVKIDRSGGIERETATQRVERIINAE